MRKKGQNNRATPEAQEERDATPSPAPFDDEQVVRIDADGEVRSAQYVSGAKRPWFWYSPHRLSLKLFVTVQLKALLWALLLTGVFGTLLLGIEAALNADKAHKDLYSKNAVLDLLRYGWFFFNYPAPLSYFATKQIRRLNPVTALFFFWASYALACSGVHFLSMNRWDLGLFATLGLPATLVFMLIFCRDVR